MDSSSLSIPSECVWGHLSMRTPSTILTTEVRGIWFEFWLASGDVYEPVATSIGSVRKTSWGRPVNARY